MLKRGNSDDDHSNTSSAKQWHLIYCNGLYSYFGIKHDLYSDDGQSANYSPILESSMIFILEISIYTAQGIFY